MNNTETTRDTHNPDSFSLTHNKDTATGGSFLHHLWSAVAVTIILTIVCCGIYPLIVWGVANAAFPAKANGSLVKKDGTPTTNPDEAVGSSLIGQVFTHPAYFHPRPSAANNGAGPTYSSTGGYDPTSSGSTNFGPLSDELINGATTQPAPPATQPAEVLAFDGVRLRTIHYAVDNSIPFKLFHAVYVKDKDGNYDLQRKDELPKSSYLDAKGNLTMTDTALVDAFPHPTADSEFTRTVVIAGDFATPIPADAVTSSGSGLDPHISPDNAQMQKARVAAARNIKPEQVEELIAAHTDKPDLGFLGDPGVNVLMLNIALDQKYPIPAAPSTQPAH
jgi:K+-transporting ATPase ATPase C chain